MRRRAASPLGERTRRALRLAFVAAAYLFATSYGMHEATNYLNARFCAGSGAGGTLCEIVAYQDDELSHLLFFVGFAGIDVVLLLAQAAAGAPAKRAAGRDLALVLANAALVAAAIVANLGFQEIGLDLVVIALVAAISLVLLRRCGPRPLIVYFACANVVGLVVADHADRLGAVAGDVAGFWQVPGPVRPGRAGKGSAAWRAGPVRGPLPCHR